MIDKRILILTDFDGTIIKKDVGVALVKNFGPKNWENYEKKWIQREMSSKYVLTFYYESMFQSTQSTRKFIDFIDKNIEIDKNFYDFYNYCKRNKFEIYIISDGMSFYIDFILHKYKLDGIPYFSNLYIDNGDSIKIEFPYYNPKCGMCGNCKTNHLDKLLDKNTYVVYIGDGYSDRCISEKVDLVFAKNDLEKYCIENNINYIKYNDFLDVFRVIKSKFN
ncbi:Haloacid Dehalogenase superfamily, subfamily IB, phosphoserine phosphatase-like/2,3-diketo-5-methylthio-1-phosphopentane phosphatase [Caloranaerobacter azorensis DSM 13643]|uniref:Haloacid Dehalogenase superfamily, subfamily IB, phosphoserine phosphatase-like/2,3-diketo-5-methylthio-1-phosphopentane phosphatase n=1 Tax=Caloranaerobacter azorensis DSM 13643 TaxID=1121264 RepID=A0A1M5VY13_9FIRM|nr:MtnX-like HAD-IB family phosphatase [Caloranaerobacter azorensis]SHH80172.1 Haloacid Dehalogenase superfamily, subfamily IB, phosphoserine phosphatase-like/2,3-diketo-5-methylthio-1-phosphopentane phosphatase [Caloranaerobacter azorensis DSM 13643]